MTQPSERDTRVQRNNRGMVTIPITLPVDARAGSGNWFAPKRINVGDSNGGGVRIEVESRASIARGTLPPIIVCLTRDDAIALVNAMAEQMTHIHSDHGFWGLTTGE